jgi:hypothetical protein
MSDARPPAAPQPEPKPTDGSFESFEGAFSGRTGSCVRDCECGKTFWDSYNTGYDWEEGEVDRLVADPKAIAVDYAVGTIEFEGRTYVNACDCWHQRAIRIIAFLRGHDEAIADFLTAERKRKQQQADRAPVVK